MSAARAMRHIGIIACSAEGASLCYRTICGEAPALIGRPYAHPEVTMHTPSLAHYVAALEAGEWDKVGMLMAHSAEILCAAGAEILMCADKTVHPGLRTVAGFGVPFIAIADAVAREARVLGWACRVVNGHVPGDPGERCRGGGGASRGEPSRAVTLVACRRFRRTPRPTPSRPMRHVISAWTRPISSGHPVDWSPSTRRE